MQKKEAEERATKVIEEARVRWIEKKRREKEEEEHHVEKGRVVSSDSCHQMKEEREREREGESG